MMFSVLGSGLRLSRAGSVENRVNWRSIHSKSPEDKMSALSAGGLGALPVCVFKVWASAQPHEAVWPWASCLTPLSPFLIFKMGITVLTPGSVVRIKGDEYKGLSKSQHS